MFIVKLEHSSSRECKDLKVYSQKWQSICLQGDEALELSQMAKYTFILSLRLLTFRKMKLN
jgi:hypothetical protein